MGKTHGVKGEINFLFTDDVFDRTDSAYLILKVDGILVPFFMEEYRFRSDETALVKFCDIDTQERARQLTGCEVYFLRKNAPQDEMPTWASLIGYSIIDAQRGQPVGKVTAVDDSTMNLLFSVQTTEGGEALIPVHEELIVSVSPEEQTISMQLPDGLLDL